MPFACNACGGPAVVLPQELFDDALVRCQRCNAVIATWAVFKARTTQAILMENNGHEEDGSILSPDPLDANLLKAFGNHT